jgi:mono/diheme cytochrome c family protein
MKFHQLAVLAGAILVLSAHTSGAGDVGNARVGLEFARTHCAGCHAIAFDDIASPNPDAPPFKWVADTKGLTRTALVVLFQSPHPTMPNLVLSPEETDNVIAYILSLRGDGADAPK